MRRRDFLSQSGRVASAALLGRSGFSFFQTATGRAGDLQFTPRYPAVRELDAVIAKVEPGLDEFSSEKDCVAISSRLNAWSEGLRAVPTNTTALEKAFDTGFLGSSLRPRESRVVRSGVAVEVSQVTFEPETTLAANEFLDGLRSELQGFSKILRAEFQVTRCDPHPDRLHTRVRYELVGTGRGFYREQRVGYWDLEWQKSQEYRVRRWKASGETRSRSAAASFADITGYAFGSNESYQAQMLHGIDYWRTVLDGACGIDIYGHNGVAVGNLDNDGYDDVYVCQPAGLPNRLYHNRRDGTFEDITEASGTGILENTACALFLDIDNDGRQDLVVVRANGPLLFRNQGGGKFERKPDAFRFANLPQGTFTGAAAADYDRDGWLDIYFCLYVYYQGTDQYKYPAPYYAAENGPPNFMMRNNRDGTFRDVTEETGLNRNNTRYSFCCGWSDYNGDGWPDLYVVNDFGRKNLYRNNGNGTFTDVAADAGVEDTGAGMSVCWADFNNDGAEDLYVANMWTAAGERISMQENFQPAAAESVRAFYRKHAMGNSLFRNTRARFQDVTERSGTGMGRWSWSSDAWDFDHDGRQDLYVVNGMVSGPIPHDLNSFFWRQVVARSPNDPKPSLDYEQGWSAINELIRSDYTWSGYERNVFYSNNGDGTFSDISGAAGLDLIEDGRAFALADFDGDGRQEVLLKNRNAPQLRLLKNVIERLPPAIAFRLRGTKSNRDAIGTVITIETSAGRQTRSLQAGSGFLSQHSKELFFGLGSAQGPVAASIRWPSGLVQEFRGLPAGHRIWIEEGAPPSRMEPFAAKLRPAVQSSDEGERMPSNVEAWLLAPVATPDVGSFEKNKPVLLHFCAAGSMERPIPGVQQIRIDVGQAQDIATAYNLLYSYLFDRHRNMSLPTYFLVDVHGEIVKIYQGSLSAAQVEKDLRQMPATKAERVALALPFRGAAETYEFGRNYLSLGSIFFQRGILGEAGTAFRQAIRDDPSSAEAHYGLGSVLLKQEKIGEARASFEQAVKLTPAFPDTLPNAWNNLGLLATRDGHTAEAIDYFQRALEANAVHFVALENLGNAYRLDKRYAEAREALEKALAIRPRDPQATYSLAMVFAQSDDTTRAYEYLRKALELRPGYPEALNNLGVLYLRTGRRDEAVSQFEECIRVVPGFDQAYLNLARVYSLEGAPDKASVVLQDLLKQHPGHAGAQKALEELGAR